VVAAVAPSSWLAPAVESQALWWSVLDPKAAWHRALAVE
jgi:hypothetical protein